MDPARTLRQARVAARLTQRELARRAGVPQSTVARIETGRLMPRLDTFERLAHAAGYEVRVEQAAGLCVDRAQIQELLRLTHSERFDYSVASASRLHALKEEIEAAEGGGRS